MLGFYVLASGPLQASPIVPEIEVPEVVYPVALVTSERSISSTVVTARALDTNVTTTRTIQTVITS